MGGSLLTPQQCPKEYLRFLSNTGYFERNETPGIHPKLYNSNFFVSCWNLSTTPNPNYDYEIPAVPSGDSIRVEAIFSDDLPEELMFIFWLEFNRSMTIDKNGKVELSYVQSK